MAAVERGTTWVHALLRPWPLAVGGVGYAAAALTAILPLLDAYAEGWPLVVVLTAMCQLLLAVREVYADREVANGHLADPLLAEVAEVRDRIAGKIEVVPGDALKGGLPTLLARLDAEVLPELHRLVGKHHQLAQELRAYHGEGGRRLRPSEKTLQELEDLFRRQQAVIQGVVQQIVDLDAGLSGLIQEGDAGGIMASAREWNERISERWKALRSLSAES